METIKLYVASSIGELNKKGNYDFDQNRSTKIHINHSEKTYKAADEARLKKDEERAYVLYMRYLDIFQKVRKSREYKKDADHYSLLMGTKKFEEAIAHAEKLSKSLRKRYEEAKNETNQKHSDQGNNSNRQNGVASPKPADPVQKEKPDTTTTSQTAQEKKPVVPKDAKSITCGTLQKIQFSSSAKDHKILLMDIRDAADFEESRIRHDDCINIPNHLLTPGTICKRIEAGISNPVHLKLWRKRAEYDLIVILSWFSEETDLDDQKNPVRNLFDALHKWEQQIFLVRAPVVLSGGYSDWIEFYPQLTTNPKVTKPKQQKSGTVSIASLSDVNFSSLLEPVKVNGNDAGDNTLKNGELHAMSNGEANSTPFNFDVTDSSNTHENVKENTSSTGFDISQWKISDSMAAISNSLYGDLDATISNKNSENLANGAASKPQPKRNVPTVNRATKPGSQKEPEPTYVPEKPSVSETSQSIYEIQNRLEEAKKKKESDEAKRKELEEKMKLIELMEEEKRLQKEAEEEEIRRKNAEKELAIRMRGLRPSDKPKSPDTQASPPKPVVNVPNGPKAADASDGLFIPPKKAADSDQTMKPPVEEAPKQSDSSAPKPTADTGNNRITPDDNSKPLVTFDEDHSSAPIAPVAGQDNAKPSPPGTDQQAKPQPIRDTKPPIDSSGQDSKPNAAWVQKPVIPAPSRDTKPKAPSVTPQQPPIKPTSTGNTDFTSAQQAIEPVITRNVKPNVSSTAQQPNRPVQKPASMQPKAHRPLPVLNKSLEPTKNGGTHGNDELTLSTSLPMNWEKRLDKKTGRYFYLDHNTKTTHWNLPSSVNVKRRAHTVKLKDSSSSSSSGGLKRSSSTPNIAQLVQDEKPEPIKPSKPSIDRQSKPSVKEKVELPDLSDSPDVYAMKLSQLHPMSGGKGPGQCGLHNLGNTCYMNSVLQCMFSTSLLAQYFLSNEYKKDINRENFLGSGGEITDGFAVLMKAAWNGKFKSITPRDFRNTVGRFNTRFSSYSQQDSQELLLFLMDGLHEDLNLITKREYKEEEDNEGKSDPDAAKMAWDFHKRLNKSIIVELFQGQFKAVTQCLHCRKTSRKFDVFMYLSVPLPSRGSCAISDCMDKFSEAEKLCGDNKWFCPSCKTERDAVRKMEIWKLPPVLLIHFKRFSFSGRWGDKLQTNVKFPTNGLDLNKYVIGPRSNRPFNLYAVSHHHGATMDSGHYVASCKNPVDGGWYKYDDHEVSRTSVPSGSSAYILCYSNLSHNLKLTST